MNEVELALKDWAPEMGNVLEMLGREELLAQLAEECAELGQAALKLRRVLDKRNPTPVTLVDAELALTEEFADVLLCGILAGADDWPDVATTIRRKVPRWVGRLDREEGEE